MTVCRWLVSGLGAEFDGNGTTGQLQREQSGGSMPDGILNAGLFDQFNVCCLCKWWAR